MRAVVFPTLLGGLLVGHLLLAVQLQSVRGTIAKEETLTSPLPGAVLRLFALEYRNLVADLLFSRTLSFHGGTIHRKPRIDQEIYQAVYRRLDAASVLDPYFVDPYYFGQSVLAWGAGMPREANALLHRGSTYRADDWVMPFFMGFNEFYFLGNNAKASEYLMEASRRPGASPALGMLAARLGAKGGDTVVAVAFLDQLAARTEDRATREGIQRRADALRGIAILEQAVARYRDIVGTAPSDLRALIDRGVLPSLPSDPYGGTYYVTPEGRIWTTSDLRPMANK
ncbi:MAG: hypothetical protein ACOYXU_12095 [Nitrospirota bacterium]